MLFHDGEHGEDIIDALARFGAGLPANVLPLRVNEVTQLGPEMLAAAFAYGGSGVAIVTRGKPRHDITALRRAVETSDSIVSALGFGAGLVRIIETDDPDQLRAMLDAAPRGVATQKPAGFVPRGAKRGVLETTFRELHLAAPTPVDVVPLAPGAPFGGVKLNVEGCTLCHACVTACPTRALSDNPDRAMLRFTESLCVQCGLCQSTCPEKVITIEPRLDFQAWDTPLRVLKEEEPFNCIACGKPFGTKSSIDRVLAKLGDKALDVPGRQRQTSRRHQDVRGLPRRSRGEREFRSACRAATPAGDVDGRLSARARSEEGRSAWIVSSPCPHTPPDFKRARRRRAAGLPGVKHVIAVASGKGGVGKSTTSCNLALGFAALGLKTGILDADIYGPSLPKLFGLRGKPRQLGPRMLEPMERFGVKVMSIGFLVEEDSAMIWRGAMVISAITQMLREVAWDDLDILVVDLPPGTGDAQLTMAQQVPLAGAVIVSTPQDIALIDARRGIAMFRR